MTSEIRVTGRPNPEVLRALLESVLDYLAEQPVQPEAKIETAIAAELPELVTA